jgi:hypothetical protein
LLASSITNLKITCRLVDRTKISDSANNDMGFAVQAALNASPYFTNADLSTNGVRPTTETNVYSFDLTVNLRRPYKL